MQQILLYAHKNRLSLLGHGCDVRPDGGEIRLAVFTDPSVFCDGLTYRLRFCTPGQLKRGGMTVTAPLPCNNRVVFYSLPRFLLQTGVLRLQLTASLDDKVIYSPTLPGGLNILDGIAPDTTDNSAVTFHDFTDFLKRRKTAFSNNNITKGEHTMTNLEFCKILTDIALNKNTIYAKGMFGSPIDQNSVQGKANQYPDWYTRPMVNILTSLFGKDYFGFDCVCLVKGVLWGWNGNKNHPFGGASYQSGGVADMTVEAMANICSVSTDFSQIEKGELLFMPGHVGVYLGDGKCCECTPNWKNGVQITGVENVSGHCVTPSRKWVSHGKMPAISYVSEEKEFTIDDLFALRDGILGTVALTDEQKRRYDMNGDGKICATDYFIAKEKYFGKIF